MKEVLLERITPEKSSLVEYMIFDAQAKQLEVKYKRGKHKGKARKYRNFSKEEFEYITDAESIGKRLLSVLKKREMDSEQASIWGKIKRIFTEY